MSHAKRDATTSAWWALMPADSRVFTQRHSSVGADPVELVITGLSIALPRLGAGTEYWSNHSGAKTKYEPIKEFDCTDFGTKTARRIDPEFFQSIPDKLKKQCDK